MTGIMLMAALLLGPTPSFEPALNGHSGTPERSAPSAASQPARSAAAPDSSSRRQAAAADSSRRQGVVADSSRRPAVAADSSAGSHSVHSSPARQAAPAPFGPGERLGYRVSVGFLGGRGRGSLEILGVDSIRSHPSYHFRMRLKGGVFFAHVDDRMESWMDVLSLASLRFEQDQKEVNYQRHRILDFYPLERRWERSDTHESGPLPTDEPLDEVSFIYFVRTLPLEIGKTYRFDRYFRADGNPVVLNVLRKERVETPAGTFDTIVVRPIIRTAGLFSQGGEAEICLSDDGRRIPVLLRSKVPVLGRLTLTLESYVAGEPPLNPGASSAEAPASR